LAQFMIICNMLGKKLYIRTLQSIMNDMLKPAHIRIYIVALILLIGLSLSAQFNVKVGYEYNRSNETSLENLINRYNSLRPFLEEPLGQIKNKSGLALGVRYRLHYTALEAFVHRTSGDSEALGDANGTNFVEKISSSNTYYGVALENQFGHFGFGASIGYETLRFKTRITSSDKNREFLNQRELASRIYLNFEFPSNRVSFSIKPYYHFSLGEYNLVPFKDELLPNIDVNSADLVMKPTSWGVTFVFYNGPQRY